MLDELFLDSREVLSRVEGAQCGAVYAVSGGCDCVNCRSCDNSCNK